MSEVNQRFEQVFKMSIDEMDKVNIDVYGIAMATIMKPALRSMKPVFQLVYEQGVKDGKRKVRRGEWRLIQEYGPKSSWPFSLLVAPSFTT